MLLNDLAPLSVVNYHKDYLIELIRHFTGWSQRSDVSVKPQLNYLCDYLEVDHINAKTIVVENEYIDRHYLEDYSEYYSRCFSSHPRKCVRVHFFSNEFNEQSFTDAYINNKLEFFKNLNTHYIGFAVIRPIPETFLAKLCVKPYDRLTSKDYKVITRANKVSLFGVELNVEATAFLEQDKVVSACATSALWTLLGASSTIHPDNLPSPSSITKSASNSLHEGTRTFPNTGLTHVQVSRSLKHFGLEPSVMSIDNHDFTELKETIYAYISNEIPLLLGGDIYKDEPDNDTCSLGKHLICVLGYHLERQSLNKDGQKFISHNIDKIYVHDDRYGPYLKIDTKVQSISIKYEEKTASKNVLGFSQNTGIKEFFSPEIAIIGLYHKIRIPYKNIKDMCVALFKYLNSSEMFLNEQLSKIGITDLEEKEYFDNCLKSLTEASNATWEITLTTSTKIKNNLLKNNSFKTFNGSPLKTSLLMQSMPKHIWHCRLANESSNDFFTDILFDATEVPQGKVLIGYISYSISAEIMWKYIENLVKDNVWFSFNFSENTSKYIGGFSRFFTENEKTSLNTLYGPLGLPRRKLKIGEHDSHNNIPRRNDVSIIRSGNWKWETLNQELAYIWVINEHGDLVLGQDIETNDIFLGHPTLVDGKPARIGGELKFCSEIQKWGINIKSGAYSSHLDYLSENAIIYLKNVIKYNLNGLDVQIE